MELEENPSSAVWRSAEEKDRHFPFVEQRNMGDEQ